MRNVHLLVLDTLADWESRFAIAHINQLAPGMPSQYRVRSVGLSSEPVVTKGALRILPELTVADLSAADSALSILPGADIWAEKRTDPALAKAIAYSGPALSCFRLRNARRPNLPNRTCAGSRSQPSSVARQITSS